jgi:membrane-associated phospholipid phosphatase
MKPIDPAVLHAARLVGEHAPGCFVAMMIIALCCVPVVVSRRSGSWRLRVRMGATVFILAVAAFALIAYALYASPMLAAIDQQVSDGVRDGVSPGVVQVFAGLTHFGDPPVLTALCVIGALALLMARRIVLAAALVVAIAGNGWLNVTLKQAFQRLRPVSDPAVVLAHGYSFPSGHTSGALVTYGMIAFIVLRVLPERGRTIAVFVSVAIALCTASSRVFLRVHFPSDILGGLASGGAWLALCMTVVEALAARRIARL